VTPVYADTSVLVRAYLADEPHSDAARRLVFGARVALLTSEIARIEFASAVTRAMRAHRIDAAAQFIAAFDKDCGSDGPITLLPLRAESVLPVAHRLAVEHGLRSLDALHLSVALGDGRALAGEGLTFVTLDAEQAAAAAKAEGLAVGWGE